MTEKEKFQKWLDGEKAKGLVDFKVYSQSQEDAFFKSFGVDVPERPKCTEEEIYKELNKMVNAPEVPIDEKL